MLDLARRAKETSSRNEGKPMRKSLATRHGSKRELLRIEGRAVEVTMRLNPRARRLIVKVHPSTGEVTVVAPSQRALDRALDFARGETPWIARQLARVPKADRLAFSARAIPFQGIERTILKGEPGRGPVWEDEDGDHPRQRPRRTCAAPPARFSEARSTQDTRSALHRIRRRVWVRSRDRIAVRDTASRWGSCSVSKSISYSWRLILAPAFVLRLCRRA